MLSGIYACASSLEALQQQQEIIANNLANVNTTGFKRSKGMFRSFEEILRTQGGASDAPALGGTAPFLMSEISFSPGRISPTGGRLDLAIEGDGFFVLESPNGPRYTRKGAFTLSSDGTVVNANGWPLMSDNGHIIVPPGSPDFVVEGDAKVHAGRVHLGRIMIVNIEDTSTLVRAENASFATSDPSMAPPPSDTARLRQGYLESSNVDVIEELVAMIATTRSYEVTQRMVSQQNETLGKLTSQAAQGVG